MVFTTVTKAALALLALPAIATRAATTCEVSDSDACAIDNLSASEDDGSVLIYPGGDTRCAFDNYTDSVTTFESDPTYFFQVFPAANQDKSKLLIFFQGGGACVDDYTCNFALECQLGSSQLISTVASVTDTGIMNRSLSENVFNDYNIVYLPYCTGDLFVGNKYLEPSESVYSQALGNKQCLGQDMGMHMNGYNNTMAVLKWALANYPEPEQLVVGGYSAGSLAAQMWSAFVANTWEVEAKSTKFQVLADSYVGVFPEYKTPASELINYYNGCGNVGFSDSMAAACEAETATVIEMVSSLMNQAPDGEWLFIDSIADHTQRKFYELVLLGIAGYPFTTLLPADEFYGNMTEILDAYSLIMNVTRFNIDSDQHVWLTGNDYASAEDLEGEYLGDVLSSWLGESTSSSSSSSSSASSSASSSTAAPVSTTSAPISTTAAPTKAPVVTTATPVSTTGTPVSTTSTPVSTTSTPTSTTSTPTTTTPASTPTSTTSTPISTTATPASTTSTPVSTTSAPVSTPESATGAPSSNSTTPEPTIVIPTYC